MMVAVMAEMVAGFAKLAVAAGQEAVVDFVAGYDVGFAGADGG